MFKVMELDSYYPRWKWMNVETIDHVLKQIKENMWVDDCDNCGDYDAYYAIGHDGKFVYYKIYHSYGWDNWSDPDDRYMYNDFTVTVIDEAEARIKVKEWLVV